MRDIGARVSRLLGEEPATCEALSGGDLSVVVRVLFSSGRSAVAKIGPDSRLEAAMIDAIRGSGAPAPAVLAVADGLLVLEDLGENTGPRGAWSGLGRVVRTLHACTGTAFGWPEDHRFGAVPIPNRFRADWPTFWSEQRLMTGAEGVPGDLARRIEKLCRSLADRLPATPRPALLHGDLWAGNVVARGGEIRGLIDPACYYGHSEVDLAMLHLFGDPGVAFRDAYGSPEDGFEDRRAIYQLWPALVHLRLFGASYRGLVERLLDRCAG